MDKKVTDEIVRSSYEVATLLFFMDKGIFILLSSFPLKFLCLHFSSPMSCSDDKRVGFSASPGRQRERRIHNRRLCAFVFFVWRAPRSLFKPLLES